MIYDVFNGRLRTFFFERKLDKIRRERKGKGEESCENRERGESYRNYISIILFSGTLSLSSLFIELF